MAAWAPDSGGLDSALDEEDKFAWLSREAFFETRQDEQLLSFQMNNKTAEDVFVPLQV